MQETWMIVGVVLLAVLVGAALPVLFQLYATLRVARRLLRRLDPKLDGTLTEVREASQRMNSVGAELESSVRKAKVLFDVAGELGQTMCGLRDSLKIASALTSALGPALTAAVRAMTERISGEEEKEETAPPVEAAAPPDAGADEGTAPTGTEPREKDGTS